MLGAISHTRPPTVLYCIVTGHRRDTQMHHLKDASIMLCTAPLGILNTKRLGNNGLVQEAAEPIYGGYANRRGEISLFGKSIVYRVNLKNNTIQQRSPLNSGAQARYDATEAGETFEYANLSFQRLSSAQIVEICSAGSFRISPKPF